MAAQVNISSGGFRSNVRAGLAIAADHVFRYSSTPNEVETCGAGEEADGIALEECPADSILPGKVFARCCTGVFDKVEYQGVLVIGGEWMSDASGHVSPYVAAGDNRPLGKVLNVYDDGTAKISFYSK